ncbi:MAG TPA: signal peptidase I [Propionibacteriaceae bacterium]|nr:signal peptidase I [Propionibacteriaceae bacterium]
MTTHEKSAPPSTTKPAPSAGGRTLAFLKELAIVLVGAVIVSSVLRAFVGQMFIIPSESMENTLLMGDRVVVQKISDFDRGDAVVFRDPGGWLSEPVADPGPFDRALEFIGVPTQSTPGHLIKRVIGLPGDTLECCDDNNRLTVNGYSLDESAYLYVDSDDVPINPSDVRFKVVVPADRLFVMGDHRDVSADSRCHLADLSSNGRKGEVAFVPIENVVGPAFAIAAPFDRTSRLRRPAVFDDVPDPTEPAPSRAVIEPEGVSC